LRKGKELGEWRDRGKGSATKRKSHGHMVCVFWVFREWRYRYRYRAMTERSYGRFLIGKLEIEKKGRLNKFDPGMLEGGADAWVLG